jgi:hypothetical protein
LAFADSSVSKPQAFNIRTRRLVPERPAPAINRCRRGSTADLGSPVDEFDIVRIH